MSGEVGKMSDDHPSIPDVTIETLCRTFFKEASKYGFGRVDYIRFVNLLLDLAMNVGDKPVDEAKGLDGGGKNTIESVIEGNLDLPLKGERILVRAFDAQTDLALLQGWLHDEHGRYFLLSRTVSSDLSIHDITNQHSNKIGIITLVDGPPIGSIAFLDYDSVQHKAELRKLIGEPASRGKGFAKEASVLWLNYGIRGLGLKKIYLNTLNTNLRNLKLNEDLGFKIEGILRNEVFFDGSYHDVLRMGLWNG